MLTLWLLDVQFGKQPLYFHDGKKAILTELRKQA